MKISIENLEFTYNGRPVLDNVSLRINRGDFVAVVGPNGSGKSTLLRCIDRILKPAKGSVLLDGKDITSYRGEELARAIGYVPQGEGPRFSATVFDTVLMGRKPHITWSPAQSDLDKTAEVLCRLHLDDFALSDINHLSGGQRQKIFIGRALVQETEVLLLDEPTANLDLRHQLEVMEILREQVAGGILVIVAIHDLNLASKFCNKFVMLKKGKIFASGDLGVLTPENIEKVYEVKVKVVSDNETLIIIPEKAAGDDNDRNS